MAIEYYVKGKGFAFGRQKPEPEKSNDPVTPHAHFPPFTDSGDSPEGDEVVSDGRKNARRLTRISQKLGLYDKPDGE